MVSLSSKSRALLRPTPKVPATACSAPPSLSLFLSLSLSCPLCRSLLLLLSPSLSILSSISLSLRLPLYLSLVMVSTYLSSVSTLLSTFPSTLLLHIFMWSMWSYLWEIISFCLSLLLLVYSSRLTASIISSLIYSRSVPSNWGSRQAELWGCVRARHTRYCFPMERWG